MKFQYVISPPFLNRSSWNLTCTFLCDNVPTHLVAWRARSAISDCLVFHCFSLLYIMSPVWWGTTGFNMRSPPPPEDPQKLKKKSSEWTQKVLIRLLPYFPFSLEDCWEARWNQYDYWRNPQTYKFRFFFIMSKIWKTSCSFLSFWLTNHVMRCFCPKTLCEIYFKRFVEPWSIYIKCLWVKLTPCILI